MVVLVILMIVISVIAIIRLHDISLHIDAIENRLYEINENQINCLHEFYRIKGVINEISTNTKALDSAEAALAAKEEEIEKLGRDLKDMQELKEFYQELVVK